jgi:hypothetical protein
MDEELVIHSHHYYKESIDRALSIVKDYIQCNRLILVGGMAMDLALRTRGLHIYEDDAIPDYDIISDINIDHAQALGKILCVEGFEGIQIVPAIHMTTMKVKYKDASLLDATYVPTNVLQKIPTLDVGSFIVIHPNFQKIDQRNSLSFLMEKTGPSLNIFNRMVKDITRNKLIRSTFPLEITESFTTKKNTFIQIDMDLLTFNYSKNTLQIYELDSLVYQESPIQFKNNKKLSIHMNQYFETNNDVCIHGFVAYNLLHHTYKQILSRIQKHKNQLDIVDYNFIMEKSKSMIDGAVKIINIKGKNYLSCSVPMQSPVVLLNSNNRVRDIVDFIQTTYKVFETSLYNRLLEIRPITVEIETSLFPIQVTDLFGRLLSINYAKIGDYTLFTSNYNYILAYFLYNHFIYNEKNEDTFIRYYNATMDMVESMEYLNEKYPDTFEDITGMEFTSSPFFVSINTFGDANYHDSYYFYLENFRSRIKEHKNSELRPPRSYPNPPDCVMTNKEFEKETSHYFSINGQKNNKIKHTNMSYLLHVKD